MSEVETPLVVPTEIAHADYLVAIEPLLALLNLTAFQVYLPIIIDNDEITVSVVAVNDVADWVKDFPPSQQAPVAPQGTAAVNELSVNLRVKIEKP